MGNTLNQGPPELAENPYIAALCVSLPEGGGSSLGLVFTVQGYIQCSDVWNEIDTNVEIPAD